MTPSELRRRIAAGESISELETLADTKDQQPGCSWLWLIVLAALLALAALGAYRATMSNASLASEQVGQLSLADYLEN